MHGKASSVCVCVCVRACMHVHAHVYSSVIVCVCVCVCVYPDGPLTSCVSSHNICYLFKFSYTYFSLQKQVEVGWWGILEQFEQGQVKEKEHVLSEEKLA